MHNLKQIQILSTLGVFLDSVICDSNGNEIFAGVGGFGFTMFSWMRCMIVHSLEVTSIFTVWPWWPNL